MAEFKPGDFVAVFHPGKAGKYFKVVEQTDPKSVKAIDLGGVWASKGGNVYVPVSECRKVSEADTKTKVVKVDLNPSKYKDVGEKMRIIGGIWRDLEGSGFKVVRTNEADFAFECAVGDKEVVQKKFPSSYFTVSNSVAMNALSVCNSKQGFATNAKDSKGREIKVGDKIDIFFGMSGWKDGGVVTKVGEYNQVWYKDVFGHIVETQGNATTVKNSVATNSLVAGLDDIAVAKSRIESGPSSKGHYVDAIEYNLSHGYPYTPKFNEEEIRGLEKSVDSFRKESEYFLKKAQQEPANKDTYMKAAQISKRWSEEARKMLPKAKAWATATNAVARNAVAKNAQFKVGQVYYDNIRGIQNQVKILSISGDTARVEYRHYFANGTTGGKAPGEYDSQTLSAKIKDGGSDGGQVISVPGKFSIWTEDGGDSNWTPVGRNSVVRNASVPSGWKVMKEGKDSWYGDYLALVQSESDPSKWTCFTSGYLEKPMSKQEAEKDYKELSTKTYNSVARNAIGVAANGVSASGFSSYLKTQIESLKSTITMAKNDEATTARGELIRLHENGDPKNNEISKDYAYIQSRNTDFQALCNGLLSDLKAFKV